MKQQDGAGLVQHAGGDLPGFEAFHDSTELRPPLLFAALADLRGGTFQV